MRRSLGSTVAAKYLCTLHEETTMRGLIFCIQCESILLRYLNIAPSVLKYLCICNCVRLNLLSASIWITSFRKNNAMPLHSPEILNNGSSSSNTLNGKHPSACKQATGHKSLAASFVRERTLSPGTSAESYLAFTLNGLRGKPRKKLNQASVVIELALAAEVISLPIDLASQVIPAIELAIATQVTLAIKQTLVDETSHAIELALAAVVTFTLEFALARSDVVS
ncbi:hypothetical protein ANN_23460 [Periplaneta americana]|uniref:Uncharacterized protein n=1 Tax=Periplaneta americana TaxID=6978 RepID=A0ABQ8SL53_PERAM|nr:hypothetical protein ANN_23460 [Periplaneta americana]